MIDIYERARHEKVVGEGWFDGKYTEKSARLVAEMQGLNFEMVEYWYGRQYHMQERVSHGFR